MYVRCVGEPARVVNESHVGMFWMSAWCTRSSASKAFITHASIQGVGNVCVLAATECRGGS
eukprot:6645691-Karenia_brevis.AAC.1